MAHNTISEELQNEIQRLWTEEKMSNVAIAKKLNLSEGTVKKYRHAMNLAPPKGTFYTVVSATEWPQELKENFIKLYLAGESDKTIVDQLNSRYVSFSKRVAVAAKQLKLPPKKRKDRQAKTIYYNFKPPVPRNIDYAVKEEDIDKPSAPDSNGHSWLRTGRYRTCVNCNGKQYQTTRHATAGPQHLWLPNLEGKCKSKV